jgi:uncharacterized YceG family protein
MARSPELNRKIRRRRIIAGALFLIAVAVAAGVSIAAVGRHHTPVAAPAPAPAALRPAKVFRIVFPEGFTRVEMGKRVHDVATIADAEHHGHVRLNQAAYLNSSQKAVVRCFGRKPQTNLEGFLFPATYPFVKTTTSLQLVRYQLQTFCQRWRTVSFAYAHSRNLTNYDVLKIASMVEAEAGVPADRAKIAATLRYGLHIPPTQSITQAELASTSPYNTSKAYGLPPTPISNPGLASIQAAAHPAHVPYLYFVRIPKTHRSKFFTSVDAFDQYLSTHGYGPHS